MKDVHIRQIQTCGMSAAAENKSTSFSETLPAAVLVESCLYLSELK